MKLTTFRMMASLAVGMGFLSSAQGALWTSGHGDVGLAFEGGGLEFEVHLGEGTPAVVGGVPISDEPREADEVEISISNTVTVPVGVGATYLTEVGTTEGATLQILPENATPGVPLLGVGTEELIPGDWSGVLTVELISVVGPGNFAMYQSDGLGGFNFAFTTADGISGSDTTTIAAGVHEEYEWAFTAPGTYEVTVRGSGTHVVDGFQTATETFTFTSIPEPTSAMLLGLAGLFALRRRRVA